MAVDVANESGTPVDERLLVELASHVLGELEVNPLAELSILLVDTPTMQRLHEQWLEESGPTDVLAFPMDELHSGHPGDDDDVAPLPALLGDVVLCPQVATDQAREAGHSAQDELHLLCAHGILHLLGYDHAEPDGEQQMFGLQAKLLRSWHESARPLGPVDPLR